MAKRTQSTEVVPAKGTAVAAAAPAWMEEAEAVAGLGTSQAAEDNIVPIVRRLQGLSPQLNDSLPDYVKGAKVGDIFLKEDDPNIIEGNEGFIFQPCAFYKDVVEWRPRDNGGGLVGRHETMPSDAVEGTNPKNGRIIYTRNGNDLIDTRYHAGFLILPDGTAKPYAIPMKSTDHTVSRLWMNRMNAKRLASGKVAPSFLYLYRLRTKTKTNAAGTWKTWEITDEGMIQSEEEFKRGLALAQAFESGEKTIESDDQQPDMSHQDEDDTTM